MTVFLDGIEEPVGRHGQPCICSKDQEDNMLPYETPQPSRTEMLDDYFIADRKN